MSNGYNENRRTIKNRIWGVWEGKFLERWFTGNSLQWIVAMALLALFLVYNSYAGMRKIKEIDRLKREVQELRLEYVSISSTLMGATRISNVEDRVKQEQLPIAIPKAPPIIINDK